MFGISATYLFFLGIFSFISLVFIFWLYYRVKAVGYKKNYVDNKTSLKWLTVAMPLLETSKRQERETGLERD